MRLRAAKRVLPPGGVLAGTAAAWVHGVDVRGDEDPVEILCPPGHTLRHRPGLRIRTSSLTPADVMEIQGLPVTSPCRTATDLAHLSPIVESVVALDAMLHARLVTREELYTALQLLVGRRGARRGLRALELADPRAESPMETRLRLVLGARRSAETRGPAEGLRPTGR